MQKRQLIFNIPESKSKKESYTHLSNKLLQANISQQELAVMAYLLSKPSTWCANTNEIADHFDVKRRNVQNTFKQLSDKGYLRGWRTRTGTYVYEVFEEPLTPKQMNARRTLALNRKKASRTI